MKLVGISGISKSYYTRCGQKHLFHDITFDIMKGDNIGILGHNGVGKSTFLRVIAGVEPADSGAVSRGASISWPIGFSGGFNGSLTGEENCYFISRIYGQDLANVIAYVQSFAELDEYFYMPYKTYSSGMKARLAFAISMALEFDLYLVDEVTAVGDISFQRKCKAVFTERKNRANIMMVSHNQNILKEYCNKIAILGNSTISLYDDIEYAFRLYNDTVAHKK